MKKVLIFILMIGAFVACSKDDNSRNSIKKATVKGAQLIYQNSVETRAGTRATTEEIERFMTVDHQGNVKPIRFITESGDTLDMNIEKVENLNKEYLILHGTFFINDVSINSLLVNKNTEAIYIMKGRDIYMFGNTIYPSFEDKNNNLYIGDDEMVYRFNVSNPDNLTMEYYLPDKSHLDEYWVNENGFCYYDNGFQNIKCPGNRIYNLKELIPNNQYFKVFCGFNQLFYIFPYDNPGIYRLDEIGNNELKTVKLTERKDMGYISDFCPNIKRKTYITSDGYKTYEFDEETGEMKEINVEIPKMEFHDDLPGNINTFLTSESLWIIEEAVLYQLNLDNYSLRKIDLIQCGYEIRQGNISSSSNAPGLSFSGLRYADGQNVVGTINEDGTITAFEKTKTSNKITTLLRLN